MGKRATVAVERDSEGDGERDIVRIIQKLQGGKMVKKWVDGTDTQLFDAGRAELS